MKYRNSPPQGLGALIPWVGTRDGDFFQSNLLMHGSRNFVRGRGGGPDQSDKKKALTYFLFFFSPQLILQKSNGQFHRNLSFFKVPEEVQHFPGGGGSNRLFPIETHITCDFPGGVRTPLSPLWIHTCSLFHPQL